MPVVFYHSVIHGLDFFNCLLNGAYLGTDPLKLCSLVSFRTPFTMERDLARIPSLFALVPATVSTSSCLSVKKKIVIATVTNQADTVDVIFLLGHPHKMFHFPLPSLSRRWVGWSGKKKIEHIKGSWC